jgi:hypothetical protein
MDDDTSNAAAAHGAGIPLSLAGPMLTETRPVEGKHEQRYRLRFEVVGRIGIIMVDHPPVNALGPGVSDGIAAAVDYGEADPSATGKVLLGAGRSYIAGASIRCFGNHGRLPTAAACPSTSSKA